MAECFFCSFLEAHGAKVVAVDHIFVLLHEKVRMVERTDPSTSMKCWARQQGLEMDLSFKGDEVSYSGAVS